ncbi:MAG: M48 family metallopeptidase [Oscillospiraceae bacterium]|jgi:predicted metal-dependent hydrolase|nr:M48 family metallopeptidase [Oscillospiraceae bacterium]
MNYILKRSKRKTISVQITEKLELLVKAPLRMPVKEIEDFILKHSGWVERHMEERRLYNENHPEPDEGEAASLRERAGEYIPRRVEYYAGVMNLSPSYVKITSAKKRFGSCNSKNGICFSWRLMRYSPDAVDYVVVHELAHIVHKNHRKEFYSLIEKYLPDYKERREQLRK